MTQRMAVVSIVAAALVLLAVAAVTYRQLAGRPEPAQRSAFALEVDLAPLARIGVYEQGRLKSFDSFASSMMHLVSGPHAINGNPDAFSYLDLMWRPQEYEDADAIYVKNKPIRPEIADALRQSLDETLPGQLANLRDTRGPADQGLTEHRVREQFEQRMDRFLTTGLISSVMLLDPSVQALLDVKASDLMRTANVVQQIRFGLAMMQPAELRSRLLIVPPPGGGFADGWMTFQEFARLGPDQIAEVSDAALPNAVIGAWDMLTLAWKNQNAAGVNDAVVQLAELLPKISPTLYPDQARLSWESWYFKIKNMTWVWIVYLLSVVLLVMSVVYRWTLARRLGLSAFGLAFALHTFALLLRWYVSGRWPNSNMFEAVTTAAWFGGCLAIVLEVLARRSVMRNQFALGSGVASMIALMCVHFLPVQLNPNISNKMPVLHDVWLYIHTNVIIFSYILISMAAVSAFLYVVYRVGGGKADYVRVGGAGTLMLSKPSGESHLSETGSSAGQVFDGATMVLMELAFVMLWTGLVMGAIWADHSWGRPWGWDPKEVFALNTFIVLALLVHTRLKVKDKGLWTAILALGGFTVMLFNWIFINFVIVGLHSYA
ncbi:MAG: cytochrome c biogenesis protein CcsA [Planctomycetota bacterium]|nr:cytochrome c biogenesis protein CcsA [Planctomycetota bacterium]